jgi:hypothetical protein
MEETSLPPSPINVICYRVSRIFIWYNHNTDLIISLNLWTHLSSLDKLLFPNNTIELLLLPPPPRFECEMSQFRFS